MGRPSSFKPEFCKQATKLCLLGATDKALADFFGVAESTLNLWKSSHPEFSESLKAGRDEADAAVTKSLYRRAMGFSHSSEKVFQFQGEIVRTPTRERYAPDTTACIFWLKNRRPDLWREKQEVTHDISDNVVETLRLARERASKR